MSCFELNLVFYGDEVPRIVLDEFYVCRACTWSPDRTWDLIGHQWPVATNARVGDRHCVEKPSRVGVLRVLEDGSTWPEFDDLAEVHHCHPVAHPFHNGEVVADEEKAEAHL